MAAAMKSLTKTLKTVLNKTDDAAQQAWSVAWKIGEPRDYLKGWESEPVALPNRPLVFARNSLATLSNNRTKGHHHRFVLIFSLQGGGLLCVDEQMVPLGEGQALLIFPFQFHHYVMRSRSPIRWIYITFEMDDPQSLEPLRNQARAIEPKAVFMLSHLLQGISPRSGGAAHETAEIRLWLALILRSLLSKESKPLKVSANFDEDVIAHEILSRVNRFLYRNMSRAFKLGELAQQCGYSESHLRNLFKLHLRVSLGRYITEVRLRKAVGLLHQNRLNITQIAQECGYNSVYAFSRTFHQKLAVSPSDYRARYSGRVAK